MERILSPWVLLTTLAAALLVTDSLASQRKTFTQKEISEIQELVGSLDPRTYRIVLPVVRNNNVVGSELLGKLPITRVRRVASTKGIPFKSGGNLQDIFKDVGGPGSHVESRTPVGGKDVADRIEVILQNLDKSEFIFLH
jgi:hypothetical protein